MNTQPSEETIKILSYRIGTLHEDVTEMKDSMRAMIDAVTKLALVEDRQTQMAIAIERSFKVIDSLEKRISTIERGEANAVRTSRWVDMAVVGVIAVIGMFILRKVGLA